MLSFTAVAPKWFAAQLGICVSHAVLFVKRIDYITAILTTQANSIA